MNEKKWILELDFIRCIACLGIIAHHYCGELQNRMVTTPIWFGGQYNGGNFGWFFVTIFLIVSGMSILQNNPCIKKEEILAFYKKRWLGIFPAFYLIWFLLYIDNVVTTSNFFYGGPIVNMIWSLFALDGYVSLKFSTYALTGEWFLGAIVIIYVLYPIINYLFRKNKYILGLVIISLFLVGDYFKLSIQTGPFRSLISCIFSFYIGMLLLPVLPRLCNVFVLGISMVLCGLFMIGGVQIINSGNLTVHVLGAVACVLFWNLGHFIMKLSVIEKIVRWVSNHSYQIFLLQHAVILKVLTNCIPVGVHIGKKYYFFLLFLIIILIMFYAWIIKNSEVVIRKHLLKLPFMHKNDSSNRKE